MFVAFVLFPMRAELETSSVIVLGGHNEFFYKTIAGFY